VTGTRRKFARELKRTQYELAQPGKKADSPAYAPKQTPDGWAIDAKLNQAVGDLPMASPGRPYIFRSPAFSA